MMFLWQRLIVDLPRGGDGGDTGSNSDGGYNADNYGGFDTGTAGDIAGAAAASAAGQTQSGTSMGEADAQAAGNIGGTSGGEPGWSGNPSVDAQLAANYGVTGIAGYGPAGPVDAAGNVLGGGSVTAAAAASQPAPAPAPAAAPAPAPAPAQVAPTVSVPQTTTVAEEALGNTAFGGFGLGGITGGVAGPAGYGFGSLGPAGMVGAPSAQPSGVSPSVSLGTGIAALGDIGPQGFSATESGFSPSTSAPNVGGAMESLGLGGGMGGYLGDTSSLAAAAAGGLGQLGGLGTGATAPSQDRGVVSNIVSAITDFLSTPVSVGVQTGPAPKTTSGVPNAPMTAPQPNFGTPSLNMTSAQLAAQLSAMTPISTTPQAPAAPQQAPAAPVTDVSPTAFGSSLTGSPRGIGGAPGLQGTTTTTTMADVAAPAASAPTGSSLAAAASGAAPSRAASSFSQETFADPLTGAPVNVTTIDGVQTATLGQSPTQSGIAGILGSPTVSTLVNTGLSVAVPSYGLANLASLGLTGTSLYGQALGLATGQGLQTGGGLIGALGNANFGAGGGGQVGMGGEGGGGNNADFMNQPNPANVPLPQPTPVEQQIAQSPTQTITTTPISYNLADYMARTPAPVQMVQTPSPSYTGPLPTPINPGAAAYFTPQGYPYTAPVPTFFSDYVTREGYRADRPAYYT